MDTCKGHQNHKKEQMRGAQPIGHRGNLRPSAAGPLISMSNGAWPGSLTASFFPVQHPHVTETPLDLSPHLSPLAPVSSSGKWGSGRAKGGHLQPLGRGRMVGSVSRGPEGPRPAQGAAQSSGGNGSGTLQPGPGAILHSGEKVEVLKRRHVPAMQIRAYGSKIEAEKRD